MARAASSIEPAVDKKKQWYYDMSGDKYLIILNHVTFWGMLTQRLGTGHDVDRLVRVFGDLGFKIFIKNNYTHQKIVDYLTDFASWDHTGTSCIFLVILTHGREKNMLAAADKLYPLKEVMDIFETRSLVQKPKAFIVQACRGVRNNYGRRVITINIVIKALACVIASWLVDAVIFFYRLLNVYRGVSVVLENNDDSVSNENGRIPSYANIFLVQSSAEGYASYITPEDGSLMIQALCHCIEVGCQHNNHFLEILIFMQRMVENINVGGSRKCYIQRPQIFKTATGFLKF